MEAAFQATDSLWSPDLFQVSSYRGDFPARCHSLLALEGFSWLSLDCTKRFEKPLAMILHFTNKS